MFSTNYIKITNPHASGKELENAVAKYLGKKTHLDELPQAKRIAIFQEIKAYVETLWRSFNTHRNDLDKHYLNETKYLYAYVSSFYLSNIARLFAVISAKEVEERIRSLCKVKKEEAHPTIHIIDFGSGPLTASAAMLLVLSQCSLPQNLRIVISAVERADKAFSLGKELLMEANFFEGMLQFDMYASANKIIEKADFILGANVLNEIPAKHHLKVSEHLFSLLNEKGLMLFVEPGQDHHAWNLSELRNNLLSKFDKQIFVISPCLHTSTCPLSNPEALKALNDPTPNSENKVELKTSESPIEKPKTLRKDWCWFQAAWHAPAFVKNIDRFCKLDHSTVNFSYVVFTKTMAIPGKNALGRVVSSPMLIKNKPELNFKKFCNWAKNNAIKMPKDFFQNRTSPLFKTLVCSKTGELESILEYEKTTQERGNIILETEADVRCKERSQTKES